MRGATEKTNRYAGWPGVFLVAITYVYFLIFAQFGFIQCLEDQGIAAVGLKYVMGAMAAGGVVVSWWAYRVESRWSLAGRVSVGFVACALGAIISLAPLNTVSAAVVALWIGVSLAWLTVTLVANLHVWMGATLPLVKVGLGTGLGYFLCNVPALFNASPTLQTVVAAGLCLVGVVIVRLRTDVDCSPSPRPSAAGSGGMAVSEVANEAVRLPSLRVVVMWFMALIWLDSAAFFIIQNTPALKSGTWSGTWHLWQNGGVHLIAAVLGGWLLTRRGLGLTVGLAFGGLALACWSLGHGHDPRLAAVLYPLAVSIYSAALVGYPAFIAGSTDSRERTRVAGRIYALAGWIGSALGIGMAQDLGRIPLMFVAGAAVIFFAPWWWNFFKDRKRESLVLVALMAVAFAVYQKAPATKATAAERGRQVYIAEGCIHCHSQYVRPGSRDELMWGPASLPKTVLAESPPLIGNRRQGPDVAQVGARRTPAWLQAHFMEPQRLSPDSPMPSYAHLFTDDRGDALVAYLSSLGQTNLLARLTLTEGWKLPEPAWVAGERLDGAQALTRYCATCHEPDGVARQHWPAPFLRPPPDLRKGPFLYAAADADPKWRLNRLAEIIKFGVPFTEMPGHEYLPDEIVAAIAQTIVQGTVTNANENPAR